MSKLLTALLAAVCCLCMTACASSNQDTYEYAESALGIGEYDVAIALFEQLGEYHDAAVYLLYAEALEALAEGELDLARANFELIAPFKSSDLYLACIEAVELDRAGETAAALAIYRRLGTFADANVRAAELSDDLTARMQQRKPDAHLPDCAAELSAGALANAAKAIAEEQAIALQTLLTALAATPETSAAPSLTPSPEPSHTPLQPEATSTPLPASQAAALSSIFLQDADASPAAPPQREAVPSTSPPAYAHCAE